MGWTTLHKSSGQTTKEWFLQEWSNAKDYEVLDVAVVGYTELYAAVKNKCNGEVFAVIYMINHMPKSWYNFGYKDMDETCSPCIINCPKRIYDLLTPTTDEYSILWRSKVAKKLERSVLIKKIGDRIFKTKEPIYFHSGCEYSHFKRDGKYFMALDNNLSPVTLVKFKLKDYEFELI